MAWIYLLGAGVFEIGFATFLKMSNGFTKLVPCIAFVISAALSLWLLNRAIQIIPLGTAYAVWTGMGVIGTVVIGIVYFGDPAGAARIILLMILVGSIIGLKLVSPV